MSTALIPLRGRPRLRGWGVTATVAASIAATIISTSKPFVLIVGLVLVTTGIALMIRPDIATLLVVAVVYSNAAVVAVTLHGVPDIASAAVPALLVVPFIHAMWRRVPITLPPGIGWLMVFTGSQVAGTLVSIDTDRSFGEFMVYLSEGLTLFIALYIVIWNRAILRQTIAVIVLVSTALSALSVFQWLTRSYDQNYFGFAQVSNALVGDAAGNQQPRIAGSIGEKNRYAQVLAVCIPLSLSLGWNTTGKRAKRLWGACTLLILTATALTYSRGAAVSMVAILLVTLWMRRARIRQILAGVAAIVLLILAVPGYGDRLASLETIGGATAAAGEQGQTDGAIRGRATQNIAALLVFADHPVVGVGPGMFPVYYPAYALDVGIRPRLVEREAHNLWLGIAADHGVLGITTFLGFTVVILRRLWRQHSAGDTLASGLFLAVLMYQATGLFLHLSYARYFWLLMAVATAAVSTSLGAREAATPGEQPAT